MKHLVSVSDMWKNRAFATAMQHKNTKDGYRMSAMFVDHSDVTVAYGYHMKAGLRPG